MSMNTFFPSSPIFHSKNEGKVIIVTRTKNRPILLTRALASILAQTYENWHLCLVNDGGAPGPVDELIALYGGAFKDRITVKHHPESLGMEAASNSALERAEGEYIIIHDDDDAWHPNFLAETVAFLEDRANARYAAVITNCEVVYEEIISDAVIERERVAWGFWKERIDFMNLLLTNNFPPICLLIRKSVFDQIGPYNASLPVLGDWDYNLRIMLIGDIGTINRALAYYHHRRVGSGNYGNSVNDGLHIHHHYQVLYRNSMLRNLLSKEPGFAGLLHIILMHMDDMQKKMDRIHFDINNSHGSHDSQALTHTANQLLRPVRWFWRKLLPLRSRVARMRGRI